MSDEISINMNFNLGKDQTVTDVVTLLRKYQPYNKLHGQAADEIERLRTTVKSYQDQKASIGETFPSDSVKELVEHLEELSRAYWLSENDCRAVALAAYQLKHLSKHLGMEKAFKRNAQYMASEAQEQLADAHAILRSDAMMWLVHLTENHESWLDALRGPITEYWAKYGNGQRRPL